MIDYQQLMIRFVLKNIVQFFFYFLWLKCCVLSFIGVEVQIQHSMDYQKVLSISSLPRRRQDLIALLVSKSASRQYSDTGNQSSNCLFPILPLLAITALLGTNYAYTNQGMGWLLIFEESIYK